MKCKGCKSDRIAHVSGKTADLCFYEYKDGERSDYVPGGVGIDDQKSYGDYIRFGYCLECGRIQGDFPIPEEKVMAVFEEEDS